LPSFCPPPWPPDPADPRYGPPGTSGAVKQCWACLNQQEVESIDKGVDAEVTGGAFTPGGNTGLPTTVRALRGVQAPRWRFA
jgi:hypothetical protein